MSSRLESVVNFPNLSNRQNKTNEMVLFLNVLNCKANPPTFARFPPSVIKLYFCTILVTI